MIQKRFPADITLKELTFLNNKKIDAELYACFQSYSIPYDGQTVVFKNELPTQQELCKILGFGDARTFKTHLQYLLDVGYIIDDCDKYILPNKENFFLLLPLKTLRYLKFVFKNPVIKIYVYLGQKWRNEGCCEFSYAELAQHSGLKLKGNSKAYEDITAALTTLSNDELIKVSKPYWVEKNVCKRKLLNWTTEYKQL